MTAPDLFAAALVGVGGACGALARYAVDEAVETDRYGTLAVNVCGSFLLGVVVAAPVGEPLLRVAGTGFCGAFTTFSSFAVAIVRLAEAGAPARAVGHALLTLVAALGAVALGGLVAGL